MSDGKAERRRSRFAIDLTIFKLIGVYQMIDPGTRTVAGCNAYALTNVALIAGTTAVTVYGTCGFLSADARRTYDSNTDADVVLVAFYYVCIAVGNYKTTIIVRNAAKMWALLDVARDTFLANRHGRRNYWRVADLGASLSRFFAWYLTLIVVTLTSYAMIPIVVNNHFGGTLGKTPGETAVRKSNVINLPYPVAASTYNSFYALFYAIECALAFYTGFGTFAFDLFALTILHIISVQYEIMASAFRVLHHGPTNNNNIARNGDCSLLCEEELQEHFLSLISDCQNIYKNLKTFYEIARPIGLLQILGDASGMICMPYLIVLCTQTNGSVFNKETIRFVCTLGIAGLQSYMYCSLFQLVSDKKESINFALYSCDWTRMNIRIKKLIILTMRLNNSCDNLKMKVTSTKSIDLPMLAYIIRSSYSIVSVIVNRKN